MKKYIIIHESIILETFVVWFQFLYYKVFYIRIIQRDTLFFIDVSFGILFEQ